MSAVLGSIRKLVFGIRAQETSFERRGFRGGRGGARQRLERIGPAFVTGYHAALEDGAFTALAPKLNEVEAEFRGFAFEGAAMGLALLDYLTPWKRHRLQSFLNGPGDPHAYMVHIGAGWALARVPGRVEKFMSRFDPLLRWLIMDGYGFHEAFFHWPRYLAGQPIHKRVRGYARRVFDQGFGRCLWFVEGTEVGRIAQTITAFPSERHGDLWSGVGLASVYAGEVSESELQSLLEAAGTFHSQLAQGAAFAAKARRRAGNLKPYHDAACGVLCGMNASEAAQVTDEALENLPSDGAELAYEIWRQRVQQRLNPHTEMKK